MSIEYSFQIKYFFHRENCTREIILYVNIENIGKKIALEQVYSIREEYTGEKHAAKQNPL